MRELTETHLTPFDNAEREAHIGPRSDREDSPQDTTPTRRVRTRAAASGNRRQIRRRAAHASTRPELEEAKSTITEQLPGADSLDLFLRRARAHPLLTAAEEVQLSKRI
ncbi:MAG: Sigma-70 factor, region 1, partial [Solirubrobacteraceae bacterium]|nr:Sigma-70 factor, region 1 [Solirubrobacteraceae bacterium]